MAHETLVHRWDAEAGAGIAGPGMDPAVAADAIDELVDVLVPATRAQGAPAGPAIRIACTDADHEWHLDLSEAGRSVVHREPMELALTLRRGAEALLRQVLARWDELVPRG